MLRTTITFTCLIFVDILSASLFACWYMDMLVICPKLSKPRRAWHLLIANWVRICFLDTLNCKSPYSQQHCLHLVGPVLHFHATRGLPHVVLPLSHVHAPRNVFSCLGQEVAYDRLTYRIHWHSRGIVRLSMQYRDQILSSAVRVRVKN
jgi:hypothetical protein